MRKRKYYILRKKNDKDFKSIAEYSYRVMESYQPVMNCIGYIPILRQCFFDRKVAKKDAWDLGFHTIDYADEVELLIFKVPTKDMGEFNMAMAQMRDNKSISDWYLIVEK